MVMVPQFIRCAVKIGKSSKGTLQLSTIFFPVEYILASDPCVIVLSKFHMAFNLLYTLILFSEEHWLSILVTTQILILFLFL
jgi:hypothetical protein